MRRAPDRTELADYHAQLARAFAKRKCACGAPAYCVMVGQEPSREVGIVLKRGAPDRNQCLRCAGYVETKRKTA